MQFEILRNPGIDFYSGFRKKNPGIHFYSGFREKKHKGGLQFEILRNPGTCIDFDSGFIQVHVYILMVASEKKTTRGGGGCNSKS